MDEQTAEPRAADLRSRAADLELRVAVDEPLALDERRQIRLIGDVEEDGERAGEEADDVELRELHVRDRGRERNRTERDGTT